MNMKVIKCHYYYLFTKLFLTIILILLLLCTLNAIGLANSVSSSSYQEIIFIYFYSTFEMLKLSTVLITIIFFGYSFLSVNDQYKCLIITSNIKRSTYFISKIVLLSVIILILILIQIIIIILISFIYKLYIPKNLLLLYINIFIYCYFYGFLTLIFILYSDNLYFIFVSIVLVIIQTSITEDSFLKYFLVINSEDLLLYNSYLYYIILITFELLISITKFLNSDLQV